MPPPGFNYQQYPPQQHQEMAAGQFQGQQYLPQVLKPFRLWCEAPRFLKPSRVPIFSVPAHSVQP